MTQTFELSPGVRLRCFPDKRFKQSALSVQFIRPMCRQEAALNALLPAVLLRGSENHPDLREITLKLVFSQVQWWVMPDQALLQVISGGTAG